MRIDLNKFEYPKNARVKKISSIGQFLGVAQSHFAILTYVIHQLPTSQGPARPIYVLNADFHRKNGEVW